MQGLHAVRLEKALGRMWVWTVELYFKAFHFIWK